MNPDIINILQLYLEGETLSAEQEAALQQWLKATPHNQQVLQQLQDKSFIAEAIRQRELLAAGKEYSWEKLTRLIDQQQEQSTEQQPEARIRVMPARKWRRTYIAAAAVLLLGLGFFGWWTLRHSDTGHNIVKVKDQPDILPGRQGAVLTLADGKQLLLDSLGKGVIANQQGASIKLEEGGLAYDSKDAATVQYNTMTTPRGRQFKLVLPDGTQVWLNAASSITYPTLFTGKERRVEITGEAYLEVAKNKAMPFHVIANKQTDIEVLGTHFNVNAYNDEPLLQTTLLEGRVKVTKENQSALLQPAQQALISNQQAIAGRSSAIAVNTLSAEKTAQVIAWKNGVFNFEDQKLEQVLKQVARWYDIEIIYSKGIPDIEFFGETGRDVNLSQILHFLEKSGVQFTIDTKQKKLIVL